MVVIMKCLMVVVEQCKTLLEIGGPFFFFSLKRSFR